MKRADTVDFNDKSLPLVDKWFEGISDEGENKRKNFISNDVNLRDSKLLKKQKLNKASCNVSGTKTNMIDSEDNEDSRTSTVRSNAKCVTSAKASVGLKPVVKDTVPFIASTSVVSVGNEEVVDPLIKRKRTKTRSKQKNIRRDNRSEIAKPDHLRYASECYAGRSLTEVC